MERRYCRIPREISSVFQTEGAMESDTVTRREYAEKKGERYETVKPKDSDILKGDGTFTSQTDKNAEFTAKRGERYEALKQGSSDIWKVWIVEFTEVEDSWHLKIICKWSKCHNKKTTSQQKLTDLDGHCPDRPKVAEAWSSFPRGLQLQWPQSM